MISVSVIGHNEERSVRRCLESVRWAGEIVFVDCASTDETARIASEFTGKVYSRENNSNLNVNKQFGIDRCAGEWVLYIDPDEVVTEELKNEIIAAVGRSPSGISGYLIPRKNYYFGRFLRFGGKYPDRQLRLFRKNVGGFECRSVHERISIKGGIEKLKNPMLHYPYGSVSDMLKKSDFYSSRKAELLFSKGARRPRPLSAPLAKFLRNYFVRVGFLDGFTGLAVCLMDSYNEMLTALKLKEICDDRLAGRKSA